MQKIDGTQRRPYDGQPPHEKEFFRMGICSKLVCSGRLSSAHQRRTEEAMGEDLLEAIEASDEVRASELLTKRMKEGVDPWQIHLSLFPPVQRVLNPPFINPHLPKMYRVCREFVPYLTRDKIGALVSLEVKEYARRPKMEKIPKGNPLTSSVSFRDIERAIKENDPGKTALIMAAFMDQKGGAELARQLLLLGSGYLNDSLGHSVSCTSFILLEMLERTEQDPWPALTALAAYFCKGGFHTTPSLIKSTPSSTQASNRHMLRASSGRGIVNLHHTITRYAIERIRRFLTQEEYDHMVSAWVEFMGNKGEEAISVKGIESNPVDDYAQFNKTFSRLKAKPVVASVEGMLASEEGLRKTKQFLINALCDQYQGSYNPHYVTGLGSALWALDQYPQNPPIAVNALFQYLDFFFSDLR
jgi:hypothetical protein